VILVTILFVSKCITYDLFEPKKNQAISNFMFDVILLLTIAKSLFQKYLNFLKEIVDLYDLHSTISHEQFQQNRIVKSIRKSIIKKAFELFNIIAEKKEDFKIFYEQFSKNIKLVIYEDLVNCDKL
jgi:molecular chaperone HtpG